MPARAPGDPRLAKRRLNDGVVALLDDPATGEAGSALFLSVSAAIRDAVEPPTHLVLISDLNDVSTFGTHKFNFERGKLPDDDTVAKALLEEHAWPELAGIEIGLCGLDPNTPPSRRAELVELYREVFGAAGAPSVSVHTDCAALSASWR